MNHQQKRATRNKTKLYDIHHRYPRGRGGGNEESNKIRVLRKLHVAYHQLFADMLPHEVAKTLNDTWLSPDWELIAQRR